MFLKGSNEIKDQIQNSIEANKSIENTLAKLHCEINLNVCIAQFCREFGSVELLEKYESYMRIRIPTK